MNWRRLGSFIARRLSREEYLGLHLTLGLAFSLMLLAVFFVIAHGIGGEQRVSTFEQELELRMDALRQERPGLRNVLAAITQLGSVDVMTTLAIFGAILLLVRRYRLLAFVWLFAPVGGAWLDTELKVFFGRPRPALHDP